MTEQICLESFNKILRNRKVIELSLKVKLKAKEEIIIIEGEPENEQLALLCLEAIELGFAINVALLIKEEGMALDKILIKKLTKRANLAQVRARIIGKNRQVMDTIEDLTNCFVALHKNVIGIIGSLSDIEDASYAIEHLITGSKHSAMYAYLEKKRFEKRIGFDIPV
jgi:ribosomal RNA assembly protein